MYCVQQPSTATINFTVQGLRIQYRTSNIMFPIVWHHNLYTFYTAAASAPTNLMTVQEGPTSIRVSWNQDAQEFSG